MVIQALQPSKSVLLQLPHFDEDRVQKSKGSVQNGSVINPNSDDFKFRDSNFLNFKIVVQLCQKSVAYFFQSCLYFHRGGSHRHLRSHQPGGC